MSLCSRELFCVPFFFFSVFLFSGCQFVRCAMLCPPRTAPPCAYRYHRATAHSDHAQRSTPLAPGSLAIGSDGNRRTAAASTSAAVGEVRPRVPHRWGSHRGTKPRNEKRFSMVRPYRETKSVSRCQSIKKPITTKWPSARVENSNHLTMICPKIAFFASDKRFLLHLHENNGYLEICLPKQNKANNTLTII